MYRYYDRSRIIMLPQTNPNPNYHLIIADVIVGSADTRLRIDRGDYIFHPIQHATILYKRLCA